MKPLVQGREEGPEEVSKVTITAVVPSTLLVWEVGALEYLEYLEYLAYLKYLEYL